MRFKNRTEAGKLLAHALGAYRDAEAIVYGIPRGGVVVAAEVANFLHAPLDLVIPRKIGHPNDPEYAIGAVTESGQLICDPTDQTWLNIEWLADAAKRELSEAKNRRKRYDTGVQRPSASGKTAIVVDDGIATGMTIFAAILDVQETGPGRVVLAVPVMPAEALSTLRRYADDVVALEIPQVYAGAISAYYNTFDQVTDEEVVGLLDRAAR
jgi:predicted phosphoribosyltransferase